MQNNAIMSHVWLRVRLHTNEHMHMQHTNTHSNTCKFTTAAERRAQDLEEELERIKKATEEETKKKAEAEVAAAKQIADQEGSARKRAEEERKRAEEAAAAVAAAAEKKAAEEVRVLVCVKSKPNHDPNTSKVNQNTTIACTFTLRKSLARLETCARRSRCNNYDPILFQFFVRLIPFSFLCLCASFCGDTLDRRQHAKRWSTSCG
jgi:hypothetical protein